MHVATFNHQADSSAVRPGRKGKQELDVGEQQVNSTTGGPSVTTYLLVLFFLCKTLTPSGLYQVFLGFLKVWLPMNQEGKLSTPGTLVPKIQCGG